MKEFDSVWDAIEDTPEQAAKMRLRSQLMCQISDLINSWNLSQAAAAQRIGITQPRLNDLLHGKIHKFKLDSLVELAERAKLHIELNVTESKEVA